MLDLDFLGEWGISCGCNWYRNSLCSFWGCHFMLCFRFSYPVVPWLAHPRNVADAFRFVVGQVECKFWLICDICMFPFGNLYLCYGFVFHVELYCLVTFGQIPPVSVVCFSSESIALPWVPCLATSTDKSVPTLLNDRLRCRLSMFK